MKDTLLNLKAIIPIIGTRGGLLEVQSEVAEMLERSNRAACELLAMSNYLTLRISENLSEPLPIEIKEISLSEFAEDPGFPYQGDSESRALQFSVKTTYDPESIGSQFDPDNLSVLGRSGVIGLANDIMADELRRKILNLFLAANIAKPGSLGFESGIIYVNGHYNSELGYLNCDYLDQHDYTVDSYIRLRELPIKKVWDWFDSVEGSSLNTAVGSVGRAIGALSYIFGPGSSHLWPQLVWALLGLEAVYAPKEQLQKYQLTTNIPKILGKKAMVKELVDRAYELRLMFIHGGHDFPFAFNDLNELYGLEEDDNDEFFEVQHYMLALLVGTLQELSERGATDSSFLDEA